MQNKNKCNSVTQLLITRVKLFFPLYKKMSFKTRQKTVLLRNITVVKCLLYLADVAGEFSIEMPRCKPDMRLSAYLRLAGQLSGRILGSF